MIVTLPKAPPSLDTLALTWAQAEILRAAEGLTVGQPYAITRRERWAKPYLNGQGFGPDEVLVNVASDVDAFPEDGWRSLSYPQDRIKYLFNDPTGEGDQGRITQREDTTKHIIVGCDWRHKLMALIENDSTWYSALGSIAPMPTPATYADFWWDYNVACTKTGDVITLTGTLSAPERALSPGQVLALSNFASWVGDIRATAFSFDAQTLVFTMTAVMVDGNYTGDGNYGIAAQHGVIKEERLMFENSAAPANTHDVSVCPNNGPFNIIFTGGAVDVQIIDDCGKMLFTGDITGLRWTVPTRPLYLPHNTVWSFYHLDGTALSNKTISPEFSDAEVGVRLTGEGVIHLNDDGVVRRSNRAYAGVINLLPSADGSILADDIWMLDPAICLTGLGYTLPMNGVPKVIRVAGVTVGFLYPNTHLPEDGCTNPDSALSLSTIKDFVKSKYNKDTGANNELCRGQFVADPDSTPHLEEDVATGGGGGGRSITSFGTDGNGLLVWHDGDTPLTGSVVISNAAPSVNNGTYTVIASGGGGGACYAYFSPSDNPNWQNANPGTGTIALA